MLDPLLATLNKNKFTCDLSQSNSHHMHADELQMDASGQLEKGGAPREDPSHKRRSANAPLPVASVASGSRNARHRMSVCKKHVPVSSIASGRSIPCTPLLLHMQQFLPLRIHPLTHHRRCLGRRGGGEVDPSQARSHRLRDLSTRGGLRHRQEEIGTSQKGARLPGGRTDRRRRPEELAYKCWVQMNPINLVKSVVNQCLILHKYYSHNRVNPMSRFASFATSGAAPTWSAPSGVISLRFAPSSYPGLDVWKMLQMSRSRASCGGVQGSFSVLPLS